MPVNTRIEGNPDELRATSEWLREMFVPQIKSSADAAFDARNMAASGWRGKASDLFKDKTGTGGKQTDGFEEAIHNSSAVGAKAAEQLRHAQDQMRRIALEAAAAGLEVRDGLIMEPQNALPAPGAAPQGPGATPEAMKAHDDAVAAQADHQRKVDAFNKARAEADGVARAWKQQVDDATRSWQTLKGKSFFTVGGFGLSGAQATVQAQESRLHKQADSYMRQSEDLVKQATTKAQTDPVGYYQKTADVVDAQAKALERTTRGARLGETAGRLGNVGGGVLAVGGVAYDIYRGKNAFQAISSGGAGFGASLATGAAAGTVIGGPAGTIIGTIGGAAVGAFTSGAVDSVFNHNGSVAHAIGDGWNAVGDTASAVGSGVKDVWTSVF